MWDLTKSPGRDDGIFLGGLASYKCCKGLTVWICRLPVCHDNYCLQDFRFRREYASARAPIISPIFEVNFVPVFCDKTTI